MQRIEDIQFSIPIKKHKLTKTGTSASIDTLGCHAVLLTVMRGSIAQADKLLFSHASASTTLYASGTAFTSSGSLTTAATASLNYAVLIEGQPGMKRYLIVKLSAESASQSVFVACHKFLNRNIPSTSTLGSYTSLTRPVV